MNERKAFIGELISECLAMVIIVTIGNCAAAMYSLYDPSPYKTAYWGVCITWGLAVTMAIFVTGAVSGTHANPAVTLARGLTDTFAGIAPASIPLFIAGQLAGALLALAVFGWLLAEDPA